MQSAEFASHYDREVPPDYYEHGALADILAPARDWAATFGEQIHDYLSDPDRRVSKKVGLRFFNRYTEWARTGLGATHSAIGASTADVDQRAWAYNELNYHFLNHSMSQMWLPIITGVNIPEIEHTTSVHLSKDILAHTGLQAYIKRERATRAAAGFSYFSPDATADRALTEGILTEFDTGIVLLNSIKAKPGMLIVPAPAQFERSNRRARNADFLCIDTVNQQVIGVQAKTSASERSDYDPDLVVVVNGRQDLGNELVMRTEVKSSNMRRVSWAGLICAHVVSTMPVQGPDAIVNNSFEASGKRSGRRSGRMNFFRRRALAEEMLGTIRPNLQTASKLVGDRVLSRLYADADI